MRAFPKSPSRHGSSLITTLLVLVILSTIMVAFMQSMSVERSVARSHRNQLQLNLAIQAGLEAATRSIMSITGNESFIVVRSGNYTYLGSTTNLDSASSRVRYFPGFSAVTNISELTNSVALAITNPPAIALGGTYPSTQVTIRPFGNQSVSIPLTLVTLSSSTGTNARFAFWIEDLAGRIDVERSGNLAESGRHGRRTGTNVSEVALYTLFDSSAAIDTNQPDARQMINERSNMVSPRTFRQILPSTVNATLADELTSGIPQYFEVETIPFGFGYTNRGSPKFNLNMYVENQDVAGLARAISNNLPGFSGIRSGHLPDNYYNTLAANIIDYADTNSTPNIGTDYRGVDSTPFVTILHDKNTLTAVSDGNATVEGWVFVQLWNPSNQRVSGNFSLTFQNEDDLLVGLSSTRFSNAIVSGYPFPEQSVTLEPNGITILGFGPISYRFPGGGFGMPVPPFTRNSPNHARTSFSTRWNNQIVDQSRVGMERVSGTLPLNTPRWTGGLPGLRHNLGSQHAASLVNPPSGDPRQTYYLPSVVTQQNHDIRTSWWGMAVMRPMPGRFMTDPRRWTDAAPSSSQPFPGTTSTTSLSESATLGDLLNYRASASPPSTNEAPFIFSNNGMFRSVTELGNVFDPALWNYSAGTNSIPVGATAINNAGGGYGGGLSLRIGRPEHAKFAINGGRASQLLDLFDVNTDTASTNVSPRVANGRVNLNTAGANALRALVAGIELERGGTAAPITPPVSNPIGGWFADAVIARRAQRPFLAVSEIATLTNANGEVFGNLAQWSTSPPSLETKDVALEELFSKVYDLATVRSRAFRVIVVGQVVSVRRDAANQEKITVLAAGTREFHVVIQAQRNTTGEITNQVQQVFYETTP